MSSLIQGYEYDIFISYRRNDNLSGWVTDFVSALNEELATTFKEPVSVYFDTSSPDGLLETYNVKKSLEDKLKCLIFIPIISQTYCDSKCFAWQHEFLAFNKIAKDDRLGRDIRLITGNVGSRILPVKIHDLDREDKTNLENELGGILRSIEFIYRSVGVNRPLSAREDHPQDNVNKTYYRDQINKVANAVKEIITSLKSEPVMTDGEIVKPDEPITEVTNENIRKNSGRTLKITKSNLLKSSFVLMIFLAILIGYPLIFEKDGIHNTGEQVLDKAINCCDFFHKWDNYSGKINLRTVWANGTHSDELIEIQTKEGFYKSTYSGGDKRYIKGIINGKCIREINGNGDPDPELIKKYDLDCDRIHYIRELHYCHFGLLMELKNSGLILQKEVEKVKFNGDNCLSLTFLCDTSKIINHYFNKLNFIVYLDPGDYSLKGMKWFGRLNAYVVFSGVLNVNGIKIPLSKAYFSSDDKSLKFIDIFSLPD